MARKPSFAIIGAGNGGLTMAGDLVLHGFEVSGLHDRLPEAIGPIQKRGGIELVGEVLSGFAPIPNVTTDLAQAVRGAVVLAMGLRYMNHAEALDPMYGDIPVKVVPMRGPVLEGSRSVPPRYLTEDVPMGLVPWASMGRKLGVATPTVEMMIHLAGLVRGADFWKEGRTMERLGLADKNMEQILRLVSG